MAKTAAAASALAAAGCTAIAADGLPALKADISRQTVSGLSSGGYMAGQFQVAFSDRVKGAGIVAAGPFGCAMSAGAKAVPFFPAALALNTAQAQNGCMADYLSSLGVLDAKRLLAQAKTLADAGAIDPLSNLKTAKIYLYSGANDRTVALAVVEAARDFYLAAGVPDMNIDFVSGGEGGHAFATASTGNACELSEPPFVNNCRYDQAEAILRFLLGSLEPKGDADADFVAFDQRPYATLDATMAEEGVVYVPRACRDGGCRVHVVFHGCRQTRALVGDAVTKKSGFADWAATNRLIVLFPQVEPSSANPKACWDWWGYTGLDFLTKEAPQMKAVAAMVAALGK
ncbi:poly(3-hydroxybutyrate) depolymerase [Rhodomicrobium sp. Az07]|uniref:extracellular catalytic domain type 2 short-chain-length polyhydroxyalkanoate depolymerase n=1 Tax=Rhodomicrobium sp. Az07 TaxID=2839034 RepID=UPI001BE7CAF8|nr:poly(3-hydroxybutyrate) depolymerase [Rhodomicrobium sp. Az07]MBT3070178.1 poly(3-hydroxybutyrate) depolymerase [Rhodomicrobium sp. Az07]